MNQKEFTHEDFKALKKALGLKNEDVALIIGTTVGNVNNSVRPNKPLPTWAKSMLYVYHKTQEQKSE